jgi:hypothetical protein
MASIPSSIISQLKSRVSLSNIMDQHFNLNKLTKTTANGDKYQACCPFHNDKSPSLAIDDNKGLFNCFGCGESGDVIDVFTKHLGMNFTQTIKELCNRSGTDFDQIKNDSAVIGNVPNTDITQSHEVQSFINHIFTEYSGYSIAPLSSQVSDLDKEPSFTTATYNLANIANLFKTPSIRIELKKLTDANLINAARLSGVVNDDKLTFMANRYHLPFYKINRGHTDSNPLPIIISNSIPHQLSCAGYYVINDKLEIESVYPPISTNDTSTLLLPAFTQQSFNSASSELYLVDTPEEYLQLVKMGVRNVGAPATGTLNAAHIRQLAKLPVNNITWVTTKNSMDNKHIISRLAMFNESVSSKKNLNFVFVKSVSGFSKTIQKHGQNWMDLLNKHKSTFTDIFC